MARGSNHDECDHKEWGPECPFCCTPHAAFTEPQLKALVEWIGLHTAVDSPVFEPFIREYYRRNLQES